MLSTTDERARILASVIAKRGLDPDDPHDVEAIRSAKAILWTLRSLGLEVVGTGDLTGVFRGLRVDGLDPFRLGARVFGELSRRYD